MVKVGDTIDEFSLVDQHGQQVSSASLLATGPLVVYFYIKAMTPG